MQTNGQHIYVQHTTALGKQHIILELPDFVACG